MNENEHKKPESVRMKDLHFDPRLFDTLKTGRPIDSILSIEGGLTKSTNFVLVGDPGVGKSTVSMDLLSDLQSNGASVLFISGEMDRFDLHKYVERYPKFGDLDILFLGDYVEENPREIIEEMLDKGYDVVLIDSLAEVQDTIKEASKITSNASEKWMIDLMRRNNSGGNAKESYTSFICIQQVTKDGVFLGTNKLKHNTSGMMELRFDEVGDRYIMFTKNRRGEAFKKLYFDLSSTGDVSYQGDAPKSKAFSNLALDPNIEIDEELVLRFLNDDYPDVEDTEEDDSDPPPDNPYNLL
jgi:predicted ATP-dependent serine protease